jgi:threonine/homoserine/homoserine lactone efflux protein
LSCTLTKSRNMPLHTYLLFLLACFALNMAFGPNNVLSLSNGARNGLLAVWSCQHGANLSQ